ncbi:hypothetical protein [Streptomyces sp. MNP-20]|uniref:hypothetical protein n=1 Tax=Streptomyces sp. MNP-20 TaxID=2721165 RepID=UPI001552CD92|nr:hypothetical protein [Streptomyces sp. MNP-20]
MYKFQEKDQTPQDSASTQQQNQSSGQAATAISQSMNTITAHVAHNAGTISGLQASLSNLQNSAGYQQIQQTVQRNAQIRANAQHNIQLLQRAGSAAGNVMTNMMWGPTAGFGFASTSGTRSTQAISNYVETQQQIADASNSEKVQSDAISHQQKVLERQEYDLHREAQAQQSQSGLRELAQVLEEEASASDQRRAAKQKEMVEFIQSLADNPTTPEQRAAKRTEIAAGHITMAMARPFSRRRQRLANQSIAAYAGEPSSVGYVGVAGVKRNSEAITEADVRLGRGAEKKCRISQSGAYILVGSKVRPGNPTSIYVRADAPAPRCCDSTGTEITYDGQKYRKYDTKYSHPDCSHAAECVMHGTYLNAGQDASDFKALRDKAGGGKSKSAKGKADTVALFGKSDKGNISRAAKIGKSKAPIGQNARPAVGEAFVTVRMSEDCQGGNPYHVAGVVAVDGDTIVTAEADAGHDASDPFSRPPKRLILDMYGTGKESFHERYKEQYTAQTPKGPKEPVTTVLTSRSVGELETYPIGSHEKRLNW